MNPRQPEMKNETNMVELIAAIRAGDRQAFTTLYELTSQEVYRTARAILRDEDAALDVQQDTYVFAYTHLDQLSDPEKLRPWLRSIAVNRAKSVLRKQSPVLFTELENEEGEGLAEQADLSPEASPELCLERKETAELVNEILAELSDGQRAAVAMYYYEQMTVPEIAEALGVSVSTVKNQLARGKKKIEEAVRALEKKGVKLYGLSPVPFLLALMKRQSFAAQQGEAVLTKTLTRTGLAAGAKSAAAAGVKATAAAAEPAAVHVGRSFFETGVGKLLVGVLAAGLIGGGMCAGAKLLERNEPAPYQPTEYSERLESRETHESVHPADSAENLNDDTNEGLELELNEDGASYSVKGIGTCKDKDVVIPASYNGKPVTEIGERAFARCTSLTSVTIPDSVTVIGESAFAGCTSLTSVTIPDSVTVIGESAFDWCGSLTSVTIPDGVTVIGKLAFNRCESLTSVTIPDSVTVIDIAAFEACNNLTNVTIPSSVTKLCPFVFCACDKLTSVTIPDSVTEIGRYAFSGCYNLTSVTIPDSVTEIGECAFNGCDSLTSVTIGSGVTEIGEYAFIDCTCLETVNYRGTEAQWAQISMKDNNDELKNAAIVCSYTGE